MCRGGFEEGKRKKRKKALVERREEGVREFIGIWGGGLATVTSTMVRGPR
jgi:hypothetical protein